MKHRLRVLLVDDDEDEYILTCGMLSDRTIRPRDQEPVRGDQEPVRYDVEWSADYDAALEVLRRQQHDVYLVDYQLGKRTGLDLLREAVSTPGFNRPIILLTGQGSYAVDLEAMRAGATDYLNKGEVTPALLERAIRYALERKRTESELRAAQDELEARVQERTQELAQANQELRTEIIERRRAENALDTERQRLFSLLDQLPAFIYLQSADYSIPFANKQFWQLFGSPRGRPCYSVMCGQDQPCKLCPTFRVFATQQPVEWEWTSPDGRCYQVYDYPFTDVDGSPLVLELGLEITARKRIEAQLEQNNRDLTALSQDLQRALEQEHAARTMLVQAEKFAAMGRMVASVAHELNNPLQIIKNCLFLTQQELSPTAPHQEYLDMAFSETQRLSNLVTQLRELYRPRTPAPRDPVNLLAVLAGVRSLLAPQMDARSVRWEQPPSSPACTVLGIPDQLKQVFLNLCGNAIDAMQPAGGVLAVCIDAGAEPGFARITFRDTGSGIPPENLGKIFEPFFTSKSSGLGLGLPISYEIIERHSGRIRAENGPDGGAVFTVWLPLAGEYAPTGSQPAIPQELPLAERKGG